MKICHYLKKTPFLIKQLSFEQKFVLLTMPMPLPSYDAGLTRQHPALVLFSLSLPLSLALDHARTLDSHHRCPPIVINLPRRPPSVRPGRSSQVQNKGRDTTQSERSWMSSYYSFAEPLFWRTNAHRSVGIKTGFDRSLCLGQQGFFNMYKFFCPPRAFP